MLSIKEGCVGLFSPWNMQVLWMNSSMPCRSPHIWDHIIRSIKTAFEVTLKSVKPKEEVFLLFERCYVKSDGDIKVDIVSRKQWRLTEANTY